MVRGILRRRTPTFDCASPTKDLKAARKYHPRFTRTGGLKPKLQGGTKMVIQHNISALNSHRQLGLNNSATSKNLEKLASGYKINRAGDDAAGLAISEKMRGQIRGLAMAEQNANNGISLIQTAEGGLNETHAILQRMRELAVQSANGTYKDEVDRENLDKEVQALKSEITRIAESTHYNGIKLLDGSMGTGTMEAADWKIGTAAGDNSIISKITG